MVNFSTKKETVFFNRNNILNEISKRITNDYQSINLIGSKGSGKSTLLNHICENGLSIPNKSLYQYIAIDGKKYAIGSKNSNNLWHDVLAQAKLKLNIRDTHVSADPYHELLNIIADQRKKIVLLVDNIDAYLKVIDLNDYRKIIGITDLDSMKSIAFIATSSDHPNKAIETNSRLELNESPFFNFYIDYIKPFGADEVKLITEHFGFSKEESRFTYKVSGGHPKLLMITVDKILQQQKMKGHHLESMILSEIENNLLIDDQVIWLCKTIYSDMKISQKLIVEAVVMGRDNPALRSLPTTTKLVDHLGLLRVENDKLILFSDLFSQIIKSEFNNNNYSPNNTLDIGDNILPSALNKNEDVRSNIRGSNLIYHENMGLIEVDGNSVKLSKLENRLFLYLYSKKNQICSIDELRLHVWSSERSLKVVERGINRLRNKIEADSSAPQWIINIKGKGYKLII